MNDQPWTSRDHLEADRDAEQDITSQLQSRLSTNFAASAEQIPAVQALDVPLALTAPGTIELFKMTAAAPPESVALLVSVDEQSAGSWQFDQGLSPTDVAGMLERPEADVRVAIDALTPLITDHAAEHRSWATHATRATARSEDLRQRDRREALTTVPQEPGLEWATDALDEPFTPERVASDWAQSTTMVRAYLEADRPDLVHQWVQELDENLAAFRDGETPPGSDEAASIYHDAVARAAIPYGHSPISADDVAQQLESIGTNVPTLDPESVRARTGITPLHPNEITAKLEASHPDNTNDSSSEVTIYGLPNCVGCAATERALKKADVSYDKIDLSERPDLVEMFKAQGLTQAPIVEAKGDRWSGFRPDKLQQHGLDHRTRHRRDGEAGQSSGRAR